MDLRAVHAGRRRPRRGLPEIDRDDLAAIGQVGHDESSASQIPRLWHRHRQGEGGSDGRIDGVATGSQHVPADIRRMGFLGRDDVLGEGRLSCLCHRDPNHSKLRPQ